MSMTEHEQFMEQALLLAKDALKCGEVPVGAIVVKNGKIIGKGQNRREALKNSLCHAEIEAINNSCKTLNSWRLSGCTLYVTLEPCPMCAGAIINSRIDRVVFGATDKRFGSVVTLINLFECGFNHKPKICGGVLEQPCTDILSQFFKQLRK